MMKTTVIRTILLGLAIAVSGCSNTGEQLLTTGSLFGAKPTPAAASAEPAAPPPVKPEDRALHVAANAARAEKCGYFFDPAALRTNYLASEGQAGATPEQMTRLTRVYDFTTNKVKTLIAKNEGYCDSARNKTIKAGLTRHLAGDFTPPRKKSTPTETWAEFLTDEPAEKQKLNPEWVHAPTREPMTIPAEPQ